MIAKTFEGQPRARKEETIDVALSLQVLYFTFLLIQWFEFLVLKAPFQLKRNLSFD